MAGVVLPWTAALCHWGARWNQRTEWFPLPSGVGGRGGRASWRSGPHPPCTDVWCWWDATPTNHQSHLKKRTGLSEINTGWLHFFHRDGYIQKQKRDKTKIYNKSRKVTVYLCWRYLTAYSIHTRIFRCERRQRKSLLKWHSSHEVMHHPSSTGAGIQQLKPLAAIKTPPLYHWDAYLISKFHARLTFDKNFFSYLKYQWK